MAALGFEKGRRPRHGRRDATRSKSLREVIRDKNQQFFYRWRPVNAEYVVGRRVEPFGSVNFPGEMKQLDAMVAARDRRIWQRAQALRGLGYPPTRPAHERNRGDAVTPRMSRHAVAVALAAFSLAASAAAQDPARSPIAAGSWISRSEDPRVALERLRPAPGYEVNLFASEEQFPDLAKPLAMTFDARGRLWVLTSPTYPHLLPGAAPKDKLVILEDTNTRRTRRQAHGLRRRAAPADGVRARRRRRLRVAAAEPDVPARHQRRRPGGRAPNHPARLRNRRQPSRDPRVPVGPRRRTVFPGRDIPSLAGRDALRPGPARERRRLAVRAEAPSSCACSCRTRSPIPWGHVVDRWGQNFISDASNGNNHYGTAVFGTGGLSAQAAPDQGVDAHEGAPHVRHRVRQQPAVPRRRRRGDFLINNVIGFHGTKQYRVVEDGSGFVGIEDRAAPAIVGQQLPAGGACSSVPTARSTSCDWFNPLIGHMQYSLRDPRRDDDARARVARDGEGAAAAGAAAHRWPADRGAAGTA